MQTAGSVFFLLSYLLLESWSAVYLNVVFLIRNIVFYFGKDKKWAQHKIWLVILLCAVVAAGSVGFHSWLDILPIIGAIFNMLAAFQRDEQKTRYLVLCNASIFCTYYIIIGSTSLLAELLGYGDAGEKVAACAAAGDDDVERLLFTHNLGFPLMRRHGQ